MAANRALKNPRGFTLLELIAVLAIVAILVTLAAPSLAGLLQSNNRSSTLNIFLADMGYARSEAIRRGGGVVLCRSDFPESINPSCSSTSAQTGVGWASGWIVFHDLDANGLKDTVEPLLRVQAPMTSMDAISEGGSGGLSLFRFSGTGRLFDAQSITTLTFGGAAYGVDARRVVCIGVGGRARIAGDGSADCGTADL